MKILPEASVHLIQANHVCSLISKDLAGFFLILFTMISTASLQGSPATAPSLIVLHGRIMRSTEKLARYHSNCQFLTKCAEMNIIPRGMRLKFGKDALPPSVHLSQTVEDAVHTASLQILNNCRDTYQSLCQTENQHLHELLYAAYQLSDFHSYEHFYKKRKSRETEYKKTLSNKKQNKLHKLMEENDSNSNQDHRKKRRNRRFKHRDVSDSSMTSKRINTLSSKTVVNISSTTLTQDQIAVLSKGPKFCPVPRSLDQQRLMRDVHEGCRRIRLRELHYDPDSEPSPAPRFYKPTGYKPPTGRDRGLDTYCDILTTKADSFIDRRRISDNLSQTERAALKELRTLVSNRTLRICPADKGGAVVVQDTADYIAEAERQLLNRNFYETMDSDPTVTIARQSNQIVEELYHENHIDQQTRRWALTDTKEVRTHMYHHLPKIHKSSINPPGRPIISGIKGPTEKLSKLVDSWLQNHVSSLPSFVKDTTHMLQIIQDWNLKFGPLTNVTLVTIDVVSLYTNIPQTDMITALDHYLKLQHFDNTPPTRLVTKAAQHVLCNNVFSFEGQYYKQVHGTAMGTPMAPSVANLFMGHLEEQIFADSPVQFSSDLWKRFIDDIFLLWLGTPTDLQTFLQFLDTVHPTIKFTAQTSNTHIPYLDILVKLQDGLLHTDLFTKPTDAHNYLHYHSAHPSHVKNNIPFSQFLRLRRLCSRDEDFRARCSEMTRHLKERAYPEEIIIRAVQQVSSIPRSQTIQYKKTNNTERTPFIVTHNPLNPPFRKWFREFLPILHSSTRLRAAVPQPPILGERNSRSLRHMIMPSALPPPTDPDEEPGCFPCTKARCVICTTHLIKTKQFYSSATSAKFTIRKKMSCETSNIIYLLFCSKCPQASQYVGETKNSLKQRFYQHRSNINKNTGTLITQHFNQPGHSLDDVKCIAIEKMFCVSHDRRLARETFWIKKLKTLSPNGLNSITQVTD